MIRGNSSVFRLFHWLSICLTLLEGSLFVESPQHLCQDPMARPGCSSEGSMHSKQHTKMFLDNLFCCLILELSIVLLLGLSLLDFETVCCSGKTWTCHCPPSVSQAARTPNLCHQPQLSVSLVSLLYRPSWPQICSGLLLPLPLKSLFWFIWFK